MSIHESNLAFVEQLYLDYQQDPQSVDTSWQQEFASWPKDGTNGGVRIGTSFSPGGLFAATGRKSPGGTSAEEVANAVRANAKKQYAVVRLVHGYRIRGHLLANINPLFPVPPPHPELTLEYHGLDTNDLDTEFSSTGIFGLPSGNLRQIVDHLRETYSRTIGIEFMHIHEPEVRIWLQEKMEDTRNRRDLSREQQVRVLTKLTDAEVFEQFVHTKYIGAKRFSLEGAETLIPLVDQLFDSAADQGVEQVIIGMPHRGRLNILVHILEKNPREVFLEFEDVYDPAKMRGAGDVKYHKGYESDYTTISGHRVHLSLTFNPSHLEWVNPVVMGRTYALQKRKGASGQDKILPVLIHGDAAFAGQGIIQECLNMAGVPGYHVGGTMHIIVNNQIGFTTPPQQGRSSRYATAVARMLQSPIFHVNGEDPEAVAQVARLAAEFRQRFRRDVVIDMYCYRKHGHNEGDDPTFTQPIMYREIRNRPSVRDNYVRRLLALGKITAKEADQIAIRCTERLEEALADSRQGRVSASAPPKAAIWDRYRGGSDKDAPEVDTAVALAELKTCLSRLAEVPAGFTPHPLMSRRILKARAEAAASERELDWGMGEMLAFATLLKQGTGVRLSGQDAQRGTFSHRHAVLHDAEVGTEYVPLQHLSPDQAPFEVINSPLSEAAVMGFDYGYSLEYPDHLTIWEAQFGDFANGAQVIIDQFVSAAEDKWNLLSGLVLFLPHGFEGQGPEHSSARLERFLALCAEDNMVVCYPTTPGQVFHLLRRQALRPIRKPLVVMTPKSLLRHPACTTALDVLATGRFHKVIPDMSDRDPKTITRILLCTGKVYYELAAERETRGLDHVAILRLEQLYPLPATELREILRPYADGTQVVWVQEEPWNMSAWYYMRARLPLVFGDRFPLRCVSRDESASPATGSKKAHDLEQAQLLSRALDVQVAETAPHH